ncbi:MAG TPA: sulfotransferase domain-containing protein [Actinomycetes bacterium]|nr:sulfotransferase domain-containing protein [Actinomycetes bacterium]
MVSFSQPPQRRYRGFIADSERWERFAFRPDDVIITTPAKCGTTWMQNIVGMLLHDTTELGVPISVISPWLDMLIRTDDEVFGILDAQPHRRFIKTHTPLDGLPRVDSVTYIAVVRHPLDVALSDRDHDRNMRMDETERLRVAAAGEPDADVTRFPDWPDDEGDYLRWFIDSDYPPTGSGPNSLDDYCQHVRTYWEARDADNVHLFHYTDMWNDLDVEMRRVADALDVVPDEDRWPDFVQAATLDSMRSRATTTAPEAHMAIWESAEQFFKVGGTRDWASLLTAEDIAHFEARLDEMAGDAAQWAVSGRTALVI